ncbi:MAG: altronate dehydratase family protein [Pirellulaceae bacterium]|nr:altronate dehydratase family protein [Pirellulaceae bacterium]
MTDSARTTQTIRLNSADNVLVAIQDLPLGARIEELNGNSAGKAIELLEAIPQGHKLATAAILAGESIIKYGQPIGIATATINCGQWVHTKNVSWQSEEGRYQFATDVPKPKDAAEPRFFQGYRRANGTAGTRNYLAIISNVNCSATASKAVAAHFTPERLRDYPNVDGVVAFTHHSGCAMQFAGQQHQILNRVMGGIARHPNIGGYLLIGLGCEKVTLDHLVSDQRLVQIDGHQGQQRGPITMTIQASGGMAQTIAAAIREVEELLPQVNHVQREPIPASELTLATQCGGSDGNSGITANPAVGVASDRLIACGGTSILAETTEIVGAEQILTRRAISEQVGKKLLDRIEWWKWYAAIFGESFDDNRSAGNAAGGLTTIAEKSLGAVAKAGSSALIDVYHYAEPITTHGLVVMDSPGFDPCSITGMVASGANMVVFTTGRGSCFGCKPVPSIKVATNTPMYQRLKSDMDIDAGQILHGRSVTEVGEEIFESILAVASGEKTKSERQGIGDEEFVPWMIGPVL